MFMRREDEDRQTRDRRESRASVTVMRPPIRVAICANGINCMRLEAVKIATHANVPCVIAHGQVPDVLPRILKGEPIGTFFMEKEEKFK